MRPRYMTLDYYCKHCGNESEIEVEVESPSDYVMDDKCPRCGADLDDNFQMNVPVEIASHLAGQAEYLRDR